METTQAIQLVYATRMNATATLAAAIIAARGKPISVEAAIAIQRDVYNSLYPEASHGHYQEWLKKKGDRLTHPPE